MEKIGIAEKKMDFSYRNIQHKMRCNINTYSNHIFSTWNFSTSNYMSWHVWPSLGAQTHVKKAGREAGVWDPHVDTLLGTSHIPVLEALLGRWFFFSRVGHMDLFPERVTGSFQMFGQISTKLSPWLLRMKWRTPGNWALVGLDDALT